MANDWLQIYQNHLTGTPQPTTVTTTTTTTSSASTHLSRVTRPINPRRRPRASRRTPTTLLNTDTTNFRAMVQHFTGVVAASTSAPATVSLSSYNTNSSGVNHSHGDGGYNLEFQQSVPQQQRYDTMAAENGGAASGQNNQHGFFQRFVEEGIGGSHKAADFY